MTKTKVFGTFLLTLILSTSFAQVREKCGTVRYNEMIKNNFGPNYSEHKFQEWVKDKIRRQKLDPSSRTMETTYVLPVVIHVIHFGEAVGDETNIPQQQIDEQMRILNEDFRRQNADAAKTPAEFKPFAADINVEFQLAVQDPDGAPTTGVVRVRGNRQTYNFEDGDEIKRLSYWPAEDYINVWVANLGQNTLGFSQFPTSDLLPGLDEGSPVRETDGVVIHYREFGRGYNNTQRSRGRTLTHELGHYFGLKHIWGDEEECSGEDYVDDTPNQAGPNNVCPGYPSSTCGNFSDMYMNYLDYTPDTCMNMFTQGQKTRMRIVIENSPRRKSLLSSKALIPPTLYSLDIAINQMIAPFNEVCDENVIPTFKIRNMGSVTLNKVIFDYSLNGAPITTLIKELDVKPYETAIITLDRLAAKSNPGKNTFTLVARNPNGGTDQKPENSTLNLEYVYTVPTYLPHKQNFSNLSAYRIQNPDSQKTWDVAITGGNGTSNTAAFIDYFSNPTSVNQKDYLITPPLNASIFDSLSLSFKYAYASMEAFSTTTLSVVISLDCGNTFRSENVIFSNSGQSLETALSTTSAFVPSAPEEWRTECINLENYAGYEFIQLAFIATSGGGNNLYLDDIELTNGNCNFGPPVGLERERPKDIKFTVSPNPSEGSMLLDVQLPFADDLNIAVMNSLGQVILEQKLGKVNTLHHLLTLPSTSLGIHFVKIKGNKINLNKKVIIRK